jgi:glycosyltransferase involved in cell wall biosynthesis
MTSVAVVFAVHNAGPAFGAHLVRLADYFAPHRCTYAMSYVIVDDGSTDGTRGLSEAFARYRKDVTIVPHERRRGFAQALRSAFHRITAEYTIVMDASAVHAPAAALDLLETLERTGADVAVATPTSDRANPLRTFTSRLRAYRTDFLKRLSLPFRGAIALPELMFASLRAGGRVVERRTNNDWLMEPS